MADDRVTIFKQFGVKIDEHNGDESWMLPMPARLIIDRDGTIRYAEINADYTIRPEPEDTLSALIKIMKCCFPVALDNPMPVLRKRVLEPGRHKIFYRSEMRRCGLGELPPQYTLNRTLRITIIVSFMLCKYLLFDFNQSWGMVNRYILLVP